ncbi:MAG TPA: hypothetical protein VGD74_06100 [Vulgatibacter sp.]
MREIHDAPVPHESGGHSTVERDARYAREDAARELIDAIATPAGRDFNHAWQEACLLFGRFNAPATLVGDLRVAVETLTARAEEAERERDEAKASAAPLGAANVIDALAGVTVGQSIAHTYCAREDRRAAASDIDNEIRRATASLRAELERVTGERDEQRERHFDAAEALAAAGVAAGMDPLVSWTNAMVVEAVRALTSERDALRGERDELSNGIDLIAKALVDAGAARGGELFHVSISRLAAETSRLRGAVEEALRVIEAPLLDTSLVLGLRDTLTAALSPAPGPKEPADSRMFTTDRGSVLAAVERIGAHVCGYSMPGRGWAKRCDCKYSATGIGKLGHESTGCPELRNVRRALSRMTDAEWDRLVKPAALSPAPGPGDDAPEPEWSKSIPRRNKLYKCTPAERAIYDAMQSVERAGCHPLLTDAVNLLDQARNKVADFVDGATPAPAEGGGA